MTDSDPTTSPEKEPKSVPPAGSHGWIRGAAISAAGVLLGMLSLGLFCHSLGVNFSEEGWSETRQINRGAMIASLVGFALATLLFWIGFIQAAHARTEN